MNAEQRLRAASAALAGRLDELGTEKVVFAESCTAGLISAALAGVPGISKYLCGSFVTYRESAKQKLLNIPSDLLQEHTAVSASVTELMAANCLAALEEATWSAAITGHLGPGIDEKLSGIIFIAIARRDAKQPSQVQLQSSGSFQLVSANRVERQQESASIALEQLKKAMANENAWL